jgi:hypothetical protein
MGDKSSGMSLETIRNGTGRTWDEWLALLDAAGATSMNHTELARYVLETYELSEWWAQGVAIGYETERGMRPKGMTSDGFAANASKTLHIPLEKLWRLWSDDALRATWLDADVITKTTATENKSFRGKWNADDSRVNVNFSAKGNDKSNFSLQHTRLPSQEEIEVKRAFWKDAI